MNYTDKELLRSAQIAYYDINKQVIDEIDQWVENERINTGNQNFTANYTLSELFNHSDTFKTSIYRSIAASLGDENFKIENYLDSSKVLGKIKDRAKYVAIEEVYNIINELEDGKAGSIGSWKLVSFVFNDDVGKPGVAGKLKDDGSWDYGDAPFSTSGDGLCAYVFETSDDSAIVAFRGSQPLDNVDYWDFITDWVVADFALALEDENTVQQNNVYRYIDEYVNDLGYDHYAFAGHSLGGNLALLAA